MVSLTEGTLPSLSDWGRIMDAIDMSAQYRTDPAVDPGEALSSVFACECRFELARDGTLCRAYCSDHGAAFVEIADVCVQWGVESAAEWARMRLEMAF